MVAAERGRGTCSYNIPLLNVSRFVLFIKKGAYFLVCTTSMLYFLNGLGLTIIINLFSRYVLIIFYVPRTKDFCIYLSEIE